MAGANEGSVRAAALAAALVVHALVAAALIAAPKPRAVAPDVQPPDVLVSLEDDAPPRAEDRAPAETATSSEPRSTGSIAGRGAATAARADAVQPSARAGVASALDAEEHTGSSSLSFTREAAPSLDVPRAYLYGRADDDRQRSSPPDTSPPDTARPTGADAMRAALDERDRELGLGADGPLISLARSAASTSRIAVESTGVLSATIDTDGNVTSVVAVEGTGAADAWSDLAADVLRGMRGKKVRVPSGARGLRLSIRVESMLRQVSGHKPSSGSRAPVLVTHDRPASDRAPSVALGTPQYRCLEGCTASGNLDPTDALINATTHPARTVAVRSLSAERLR